MAGIADNAGWGVAMVDTQLAWELADAVKGHLDANQRNAVYIAIAADDLFWAVAFLLQAIVRSGVAIRRDLRLKLNRWVASYRDHPEQPRLRDLIGCVRIQALDPAPTVPPPPTLLAPVTRYRRPNRVPRRRMAGRSPQQ